MWVVTLPASPQEIVWKGFFLRGGVRTLLYWCLHLPASWAGFYRCHPVCGIPRIIWVATLWIEYWTWWAFSLISMALLIFLGRGRYGLHNLACWAPYGCTHYVPFKHDALWILQKWVFWDSEQPALLVGPLVFHCKNPSLLRNFQRNWQGQDRIYLS